MGFKIRTNQKNTTVRMNGRAVLLFKGNKNKMFSKKKAIIGNLNIYSSTLINNSSISF